jgi:hypothetical protein
MCLPGEGQDWACLLGRADLSIHELVAVLTSVLKPTFFVDLAGCDPYVVAVAGACFTRVA